MNSTTLADSRARGSYAPTFSLAGVPITFDRLWIVEDCDSPAYAAHNPSEIIFTDENYEDVSWRESVCDRMTIGESRRFGAVRVTRVA